MSIEERLAELTEAIRENSELLRTITAKATGGMSSSTKAGKDDDEDEKPSRTRRSAKDEDEKPARTRRSAKDDDDTKPARASRTKKAPSVAEMKEKATAFLEGADDDDDYKARREAIKELSKDHGSDKFSEIDEDKRADALDDLKGIEDGWGKKSRRSHDDDDV